MRPVLSLVTIYNNPSDQPGFFVARRFYSDFATKDSFAHIQIEPVRRWAQQTIQKFNSSEAIVLPRSPEDEPHIVETWL